jgi:hypothetical protein
VRARVLSSVHPRQVLAIPDASRFERAQAQLNVPRKWRMLAGGLHRIRSPPVQASTADECTVGPMSGVFFSTVPADLPPARELYPSLVALHLRAWSPRRSAPFVPSARFLSGCCWVCGAKGIRQKQQKHKGRREAAAAGHTRRGEKGREEGRLLSARGSAQVARVCADGGLPPRGPVSVFGHSLFVPVHRLNNGTDTTRHDTQRLVHTLRCRCPTAARAALVWATAAAKLLPVRWPLLKSPD